MTSSSLVTHWSKDNHTIKERLVVTPISLSTIFLTFVQFSAKDIDIPCAIRVQGHSNFSQFFVVHDCTVHWKKEKRDKEDNRDRSFFNLQEAKLGIEDNR